MRAFTGFDPERAKRRAVGIPAEFFSELLPQIGNVNELKVTLHLFYLAAAKQSDPKWVGYWELAESEELLRGLRKGGDPRQPVEHLREGLELALNRGSILRIVAERNAAGAEGVVLNRAVGDDWLPSSTESVEWFLVNTPANRTFSARLERGDVELAQTSLVSEDAGWRYIQRGAPEKAETGKIIELAVRTQRPNIYTLYEQNIGMLTPLMSDRLREAAETYPAEWVEDAFREAVTHNKRNWAYINRVLENWSERGRVSGSESYELQKSFRRTNTAVPPSKSARTAATADGGDPAGERGHERERSPLRQEPAAASGTGRTGAAGEPYGLDGLDGEKYLTGKYSHIFNRKPPPHRPVTSRF